MKKEKGIHPIDKASYGGQAFEFFTCAEGTIKAFTNISFKHVSASGYRSIQWELSGATLFWSLTSLPQRMPQVSTARLVLASASLRKLWHSSAGTAS